MKLLLATILFTTVWVIAGKLLIYCGQLHQYNEEMKRRSNVPHATPPPCKPSFFNHLKQ